MATPKAVAVAEQAARDKQQATLDEILTRLKRIETKLGIAEPQQLGESPVDPVLQVRAEREVEAKAAELPRPATRTVDPKAEAERIRQQARRNK